MREAINIQGISKKYKLHSGAHYVSLRESISETARNLFKRKAGVTDFWALQDIDFTVGQGERVGIIGRNGAGKSTLLKIISRITPPTSGQVTLHGRVASLLEVGTGFHPELTGRENIYFNGSILGLKKKEIDNRLEAIIDFSGIKKFIDSQLKHYSSGMQLRLAFSVAAHLDPEILVIDEVLAVGDLEFQQKCLGKMEEVSRRDGRTILFVSHNMDVIRKFCSRSVLLESGKLVFSGSTEGAIHEYLSKYLQTKTSRAWDPGILSYEGSVKLLSAIAHDESLVQVDLFETVSQIGITIEYEVLNEDVVFTHGLNVFNQEQVNVFSSHDVTSPIRTEKRKKGLYRATAWPDAPWQPRQNLKS